MNYTTEDLKSAFEAGRAKERDENGQTFSYLFNDFKDYEKCLEPRNPTYIDPLTLKYVILTEQYDDLEERLDTIKEEIEALPAYRGNGNIYPDYPNGEWLNRQEVLNILK